MCSFYPSLIPNIVTMYFTYSMVQRSSLFVACIPDNVTGQATISTYGISWRNKYFARNMWSSVVIRINLSNPARWTFSLIACAYWYVDFDSDSIFTCLASVSIDGAPAPIIYRSASGYFRI